MGPESASPWMALGGAGLGLVKGELFDRPALERQRQIEAVKARYSPWTGIKPQDVPQYNPLNNVLQGAGVGFSQGQEMEKAQGQNDFNQGLLKNQQMLGKSEADKNAAMAQYYQALADNA